MQIQAHLIAPFNLRHDVAGHDGKSAAVELQAGKVVGQIEALDALRL